MPSRAYRVTRAWRRRPGSASVLVAGLAAEAEQAVEQALGLLRAGVVGRPRLTVARFRAGQHFRDGVADDPHAHALGQLDLCLGVADDLGHRADQDAGGDDLVAAPDGGHHLAMLLPLLLLRTNQQEARKSVGEGKRVAEREEYG